MFACSTSNAPCRSSIPCTNVLVLTYRDNIRHAEAAHMLGMSERTICYLLPAARRRLADILDRLDLL